MFFPKPQPETRIARQPQDHTRAIEKTDSQEVVIPNRTKADNIILTQEGGHHVCRQILEEELG